MPFKFSAFSVFGVLLVMFGQTIHAQETGNTNIASTDTLKKNYDNNQMDVRDLLRLVFKKPNWFKLKNENSAGPFIVVIPYPSYSIATGVEGVVPINISFYTNKKERSELSFFNNNFQYTQYKQTIALSISNIFLGHDKWELIGDYRFYNFPTYTYGLGSETTLLNEDRISYNQVRFYQLAMRQVVPNLSVGIGYHVDYHYDISDFNANNGVMTDFQRYGFASKSLSSGASVNLLYDSRDNTNAPVKGVYISAQFRANLSALGSNTNYNSITIDCRKYIRLQTKWYLELAFWGYAWITTNGKPPYLDLPATGADMFNNTGRGYALGRFRGLNMAYFETELRFSILRGGLLGGVVFANMESLSEWPGNNLTTFQPGIGFGLRIKLNKKVKTSSAVDYGFGTGGSKGFAFNLNEVY